MLKIGIIDDAKIEQDDIQVSIFENWEDNSEIGFEVYVLEGKDKVTIFSQIMEDVLERKICTLIVDFKLDTTIDVIKGSDIVEFCHEKFPEFPVIILTNAPEESKASLCIDADKVYAKTVFLNPELIETKTLVNNIILNIKKYNTRRDELECNLMVALEELVAGDDNIDALGEVMAIEDELSKYKPMVETKIDRTINVNDLKEVFELLDKYEKLAEK